MSRLRTLAATTALTAAAVLTPASAFAQAAASPYTSALRYDAIGRVTGTISADPDGAGGNPFLAVRNSYDVAGRLIKVETGTLSAWQSESVAPSAWSGFTVVRTLEMLNDAMGRKTRETLREGAAGTIRAVTQYGYDSFGRPDCTAVRMNSADFASPPASACTQGTGAADRIARIVYDAAGQRLQVRVGVGSTVEATRATWAYNAAGQVTTVIDGNGNRAELRYDGHGRQDRWTFPSATRAASYNDATQATAFASAGAVNAADYEEYSYDAGGNRTNLRKRDGRNIAFAYDALGRMTSKTYPQGGATAVYYAYDLRNLQLSARFTSQSGEGITSAYDGFGRLASSSTNMGAITRTLVYSYDANGNRLTIAHPDGHWFGALYDGLNRQYYLQADAALAMDYMYFWPHGATLAVGRPGIASWIGYDEVQRPAAASHIAYTPAATDVVFIYARNPAGQIASVARDNDAYAWTSHYAVTRPYTTNGLNQYSAAGGASFTYDANGNLRTSPGPAANEVLTYGYDIENRLVGRTSNGASPTAALSYDPLGRLYEVSSAGGPATRFLYDGDALVAEYVAGTMTRRHAHWTGADVPMATFDVPAGGGLGTVRHLFADHQGSIIASGDAAGAIQSINRYDEYGIPAAANTGRFQYTGQAWLAELGLYHYKARIYSPTLGRFLQTDPVGYQDQHNLYAYVGNDPVNATDPTGLATLVWSTNNDVHVIFYVKMVAVPGASFGFTGEQLARHVSTAVQGPTNFEGRVVNMTSSVVIVPVDDDITGGSDVTTMTQHTAETMPRDLGGNSFSLGRQINLAPHAPLTTAAHEVPHPAGAGDQRIPGVDADGNDIPLTAGPFDVGLMNMGQARTNDQTRGEILRSVNNINIRPRSPEEEE